MPDNSRGTDMRKHLASNLDTFNTEKINRKVVADHLGHHLNIHNKFYRMPNAGIDIVIMTPVLENACRKSTLKRAEKGDMPDGRRCLQTITDDHFEVPSETPGDMEIPGHMQDKGTDIDQDDNSSSDDDCKWLNNYSFINFNIYIIIIHSNIDGSLNYFFCSCDF